MARISRPFDNSNLDPLMDVVTNVVGVMLFVVIFAVMAARSSSVKMFTPLLSRPAADRDRVLFLCTDGDVRRFDWDMGHTKALERAKGLGFAGVPRFVNAYNELDVRDENFSYRLSFETEPGVFQSSRKVFMTAEMLPGALANGDDGLAAFTQVLGRLDPSRQWIAFLVDDVSLDVYRSARDLATAARFAVGWDPGRQTFPHKECILGCGQASGQPGLGWGIQ